MVSLAGEIFKMKVGTGSRATPETYHLSLLLAILPHSHINPIPSAVISRGLPGRVPRTLVPGGSEPLVTRPFSMLTSGQDCTSKTERHPVKSLTITTMPPCTHTYHTIPHTHTPHIHTTYTHHTHTLHYTMHTPHNHRRYELKGKI